MFSLPYIVDFPHQPLKNFFSLFLVFKGVDGNFIAVKNDNFSLKPKGYRRRVLEVFISSQFSVQIGKRLADVLVQMCDAVYRLKSGIAFGA